MNNSKPMVCKHCGYDVFISGASLEQYQRLQVLTRCNDTNRSLSMWSMWSS